MPRFVATEDVESFRSSSLQAQRSAALAGAGIVILPAYLADDCEGLVPVLPDSVAFVRTYWILMPIELKNSARVRLTYPKSRTGLCGIFLQGAIFRQELSISSRSEGMFTKINCSKFCNMLSISAEHSTLVVGNGHHPVFYNWR